jgi:Flp pilus assembly protein TadG
MVMQMPKILFRACRFLPGRFVDDRTGASAVEFALLLPIMLLLYAGSSEISEALTIDRKVNRVASTVGDLVTQQSTVGPQQMTNILKASSTVMQPYDTSEIAMMVMAVDIDADGAQTVAWSVSEGMSGAIGGSPPPIQVPADIAAPGTQIIVTQVRYSYTSPFSEIMRTVTGSGTYNYDHVFMARPRLGNSVNWSN